MIEKIERYYLEINSIEDLKIKQIPSDNFFLKEADKDKFDLNKFFYYGPMFRRERPQSGRLRQFHQVGVEYIGSKNHLADLEVIILAEEFLKDLKIRKKLKDK